MVEEVISNQSNREEKPGYLDSKVSVDSTCSTRVNNSTDFSVYSSDSFDVKTTNVESTRSPASSIEENSSADPSRRLSNEVRIQNNDQGRQSMEREEESYTVMSPEYDYKRKRVMFDASKREGIPEYVSEEILNKAKYGSMSSMSRSNEEYYYGTGGESSTGEQKEGISKSLDEIMKNVNSSAYKVYEDDIMELEKCSKKMKYEEDEGYSQFDSNTSTVNSDSNSVADGAESGGQMEGEEVNERREERSSEARRVFKDIFDPKNWDKSWTIYTKPRKDRSAELVSELYVFMLQLKLLNSLELVRAVCRPWGVPPHGNDYVFHFDQIAGCGDLSLLQKYEEVFAPLYGKFKAGSPSVLWTRLADVDYFKIVFKLECIRFKQPFSSTIYENILRYTLTKLHAAKKRSEMGMEEDEETSPVGDLESLNNKNAMDEMNTKRKVCGVCGNIVKRECTYCASMDNSPSNRVLISKVQVSTEEGVNSEYARNRVSRINGEGKVAEMSRADTGGLQPSSVDAVAIEVDGEEEMRVDGIGGVREVVESGKYAAGGSVDTAYVAGGRDAVVNGSSSRTSEERAVSRDGCIKGREEYGRESSVMTRATMTEKEYGGRMVSEQINGLCNEHGGSLVCLEEKGGRVVSKGEYSSSDVYALSAERYYSSGKKNEEYEKEVDEVYDVSMSGGMEVRSVERRRSSDMEGDEWPERRISETEGFILTNFSAGNEYESPNVYKEDLATSFKYSTPSVVEKQSQGVTGGSGTKEGVYTIMGNSQEESEDMTSNDNNTRLISSDLVDASEVDVTTHSNVDFGEHFLDNTAPGESCTEEKGEGENRIEEDDRKLKEEMVKNAVFREGVLKTNLFKDNPLTEDMLKKLDRDYNYNAFNRGYTAHYKKGEGADEKSSGSNNRSNIVEGVEVGSGISGSGSSVSRSGMGSGMGSGRGELGELSRLSGVNVGRREGVDVEGYLEGKYKEGGSSYKEGGVKGASYKEQGGSSYAERNGKQGGTSNNERNCNNNNERGNIINKDANYSDLGNNNNNNKEANYSDLGNNNNNNKEANYSDLGNNNNNKEASYSEREEYLQYLSENYGLLDEEVLMRDEAILASLDEDMVNSEVTEEESYHQVTDQDIEKIVLSVLNRRLSGEYTKYDQNPLMALYGSNTEDVINAAEQINRVGSIEGYGQKGEKGMQSKKVKKKEDDYRNVDKYAYVENKYARMENRYNYMDYTPSYYTTSSSKDKKKVRDMDYEFPNFNRGKLTGKINKVDKQEKGKKNDKQVKTTVQSKGDTGKRKFEVASPFKSHVSNMSRYYREGYYDDVMQQKQYGAAKDKEIKISSHVVSASVSYDKRQQRFMAQWKTREGTKHSKSFYAKRYASPIMARKHAELYKMYILQHRVMNASELVEPTYEQLLANNFKDLDSINVGELDYDL